MNWQAGSSAPSSVPPRRAEVGRMLGSWSCQFPSLSTRQDWQSETSGARQVLFRGRSGLAMHTTSAWAAGGHLCRRPARWNAELGRHLQRQAAAGSLQRSKLWVPASFRQSSGSGIMLRKSTGFGAPLSCSKRPGAPVAFRFSEDPDGSEPGWSDMRGVGLRLELLEVW